MDPSMSEEEVRKYIHSFANDGRNPPSTVFNVFQTALKLFNGGGGSALNSHWNYPSLNPLSSVQFGLTASSYLE
jgi:hypothetical protein